MEYPMGMDTPKNYLGHISGGRVLDVATGSGSFIHFLVDGLRDYAEIVGIDTSERAAAVFADAFKEVPGVRFETMDATRMDYQDGSFDVVSIANSLHHFVNPPVVLGEIKRVLKPGGYFVCLEMVNDGQTGAQQSHVLLHHWWAAVDRASGIVHNETYPRAGLVELLSGGGWESLAFHELVDLSEDPKQPELLEELNGIIDRYVQRAEGHPALQAEGEALRQRVGQVGFHGATALLAVGRKAASTS